MIWLGLFVGLAALLVGGEALVRGSVALALRLGVSPFVIGLTLVGFGTSMPELVASLEAATGGAPGIALGNIVGSNIANILLILGVSAVIFPIAAARGAVLRDGVVMIGASLVMVALALFGSLGALAGAGLVLALAVYTLASWLGDRRGGAAAGMHEDEAAAVATPGLGVPAALALTAGGIVGVVWGADLLVGAAIEIARAAGVSEAVIGLTLVAVGTSLPELATSVTAALRRQGDVALGNVIGSNVFNILGIGGVTALVTEVPVPGTIAGFDVWVMLATAVLAVVFALTAGRISRGEGALFVALYGAYIAVQLSPGLRAALGLV